MALLATALIMGLLSGMGGVGTIKAITSGFAKTVQSIGIVIILVSCWGIIWMLQKAPIVWLLMRCGLLDKKSQLGNGHYRISGIHSRIF